MGGPRDHPAAACDHGDLDAVLRRRQRHDRARRLPAAAARAAPRTAHHRGRHVVRARGSDVPVARPVQPALPERAPRRRDPAGRQRRDDRVQGHRGRRDRDRAHDRAQPVRRALEARQGDARDRAGPRRRRAHGDRHQSHDRGDVLHRRDPRGGRRDDLRPVLQQHRLRPRLLGGARGVHRGRVRRHRQHPGRRPRRARHRDDPIPVRRLLRLCLDPGHHLRDPHPRARLPSDRDPRDAGPGKVAMGLFKKIRLVLETAPRKDPNPLVYGILTLFAIAYPFWAQISTGGQGDFLLSVVADAGVYVLLAIGLNVVVGFAGLLDLGYAAFFAIGAYTYAFLASDHLLVTPLATTLHLPFWIVLLIGMFVAAGFGLILGAPTLRLRGDYLAIVTLGFGEIVPRVFKNAAAWTSGVNGVSALDKPQLPYWVSGPWVGEPLQFVRDLKIVAPLGFYVIMVLLLGVSIVLVNNLRKSRVGRAWMAVREDEVAAAAMGVNTVRIKLLAFAIGAAFSGFAGAYYGAKLSLVSPENFGFAVSITILVMIVLGGMGNIPGVIVGSLLIYYVIFIFLPELPPLAEGWAAQLGFSSLVPPNGEWPGIGQEVQRLKLLLFGIILVTTMLLRPQGLIPSRVRAQELIKGVHEDTTIEDVNAETTA